MQKSKYFAKSKIQKSRHFLLRNFSWLLEIGGGGDTFLLTKNNSLCIKIIYAKNNTLSVTFLYTKS